MKRLLWLVMIAGAAACGSDAKKDTTMAAAPQAGVVLNVQPASLSATVEGNPMELAIDASGMVTANGKPVAKLTPAGEARDENDRVIATIAGDGRLSIVGEPSEDIVIRDDGTIMSKGEAVVSIGPDAVLAGKLISEQDAKVSYAGPPEARRAMMLAFVLAMAPTNSGDSGAPATSGASVEPVPAP